MRKPSTIADVTAIQAVRERYIGATQLRRLALRGIDLACGSGGATFLADAAVSKRTEVGSQSTLTAVSEAVAASVKLPTTASVTTTIATQFACQMTSIV